MATQKIAVQELVIDGVTYVPKDSQKPLAIGDKRIIVADKGFVFVGSCVDNDDGSVTITNTKCLRRWGTTMGLGQITSGPTPNTIAEPCGTIRTVPVIHIACTPDTRW